MAVQLYMHKHKCNEIIALKNLFFFFVKSFALENLLLLSLNAFYLISLNKIRCFLVCESSDWRQFSTTVEQQEVQMLV